MNPQMNDIDLAAHFARPDALPEGWEIDPRAPHNRWQITLVNENSDYGRAQVGLTVAPDKVQVPSLFIDTALEGASWSGSPYESGKTSAPLEHWQYAVDLAVKQADAHVRQTETVALLPHNTLLLQKAAAMGLMVDEVQGEAGFVRFSLPGDDGLHGGVELGFDDEALRVETFVGVSGLEEDEDGQINFVPEDLQASWSHEGDYSIETALSFLDQGFEAIRAGRYEAYAWRVQDAAETARDRLEGIVDADSLTVQNDSLDFVLRTPSFDEATGEYLPVVRLSVALEDKGKSWHVALEGTTDGGLSTGSLGSADFPSSEAAIEWLEGGALAQAIERAHLYEQASIALEEEGPWSFDNLHVSPLGKNGYLAVAYDGEDRSASDLLESGVSEEDLAQAGINADGCGHTVMVAALDASGALVGYVESFIVDRKFSDMDMRVEELAEQLEAQLNKSAARSKSRGAER